MEKSLKKRLFLPLLLASLLLWQGAAHAAAQLPSSAVWFEPATAAAGAPITLNALVYNSQDADATVTVAFTAVSGTIATEFQTVTAHSAKTVSSAWKMPAQSTAVTVAVIAATDSRKKSLPTLLGTIGTVTVSSAPAPLIGGIAIPGSAQVSAWSGPFFKKIEAFRIAEAARLTVIRDGAKATVMNNISQALAHPVTYVTLLYSSAGVEVFGNQVIFYIAAALLLLLLLRFVVNLVF